MPANLAEEEEGAWTVRTVATSLCPYGAPVEPATTGAGLITLSSVIVPSIAANVAPTAPTGGADEHAAANRVSATSTGAQRDAARHGVRPRVTVAVDRARPAPRR